MARPLRIQFPGAFYHITCRGIERRDIYQDDNDRSRFLGFLWESLGTYQVVLHAYILMANHFHLLIQTRKANCSEFMRHFNICYTGWFNYRHQRCGNLYQGRYKAFLIDADNYLLEVSRYLHLNIVRKQKMSSLTWSERWWYAREYHWSSLTGYISEKQVVSIINYDMILAMVGGRVGYRAFIVDGLKRDIASPFKDIQSGLILGDQLFLSKVKGLLKHGSLREQPAYRDLMMRTIEPKVVIGIITKAFTIKEQSLKQRRANGKIRAIAAELLYRYCDLTQSQIGTYLGGIDYISVHQLRYRLRAKMSKDSELRKRYAELEAMVKAACIM